ncbi:replicative DNA helicase [Streptococcus pneumoniae]|uniref:replicative DNA helicase n=1 Tax=Streptococcus pneumoniae TaxID=1313 RepID=UPI0005DDB521|nr:replicative DNA helicase [Streptococcus pneumoniae]CIO22470.1 DNA polymerase III delta prime subunit [Streptococcus pneumoniae]CIP95261.1 DNA polymerase III delta prime subunit [Streptococcus pneumoniae]CJC29636.1 DNA polymerase III delta prime subunit [Streptococcus pneumoniae]CJC93647.1 DNA polymerase III delta prime subunit [Streptococcus pneumoniae]CJH48159.1 DNA polymerase III delta prime subunit [Streptococcus pneumoniae]
MSEEFRILPHDLVAEQSVLGAVFIAPDTIISLADELIPDDFYKPANKIVFKTMLSLFKKGEPIDATTMVSALTNQGQIKEIGGINYVVELVNSTPTSKNVEHYAKLVKEKSTLRRVIADLSESLSSAYQGDVSIGDIIAKTEKSMLDISNQNTGTGFRNVTDILDTHMQIVETRSQTDGFVTGLSTGFVGLDKITTGLHEGNFIILAARPAMGKTALALNIAKHVATMERKPAVIFSLEMGAEELIERMVASEGMIPGYHLKTGNLSTDEWKRLVQAQSNLYDTPIFVDDTAGIRISEIRSKARKLSQEMGGLGIIIIDYLQLITGSKGENRQQVVSEISRELKILAKDLRVPVIALSQLSRSVEQRQDKRPMLSDLRESGSIEQDADIVAFLYRDAYYQKEHADSQEANNVTELILEKNRHGSLGIVKLYFHKEYTKFSSVEEV